LGVERTIVCRPSTIEEAAIESIAAMAQTALDWLPAQLARRACGALAFRIAVRARKKKASMPARRADHGDAPQR
jgi:hypothetical protein